MVYESDFYTVRRPYSSRITPTISSYSVSIPSQVTKYLPGVGKVYVVNTLPRYVVPYPGHKPITYTTYTPTQLIRVRPSSYIRELDRIEHKYRTPVTYSYLDEYLSSPTTTVYYYKSYPPYVYPYGGHKRIPYYTHAKIYSAYLDEIDRLSLKHSPTQPAHRCCIYDFLEYATTFDDEKRAIHAKSQAILQAIHTRVPRVNVRVMPLATLPRYPDSDTYLRQITKPVRNVARDILNISYYSEPVKKFLGPGHLACIRFAGDRAYSKRRHLTDITEHVIRNDINLLSYYLKNREAAQLGSIPKSIKVIGLDPLRPTRIFGLIKPLPDPADEQKEVAELKAANRARTLVEPREDTSAKLREKRRKQEEEKAAEERALAEERARQKEKAKKEEEARRAELQKQAELEKQRLLEEEAEREAQRIEKARKEAEARLEEEKRLAAEKKAEEERLAAEKRAEEERLAAEKKAEEERLAAEKKAEEERLAAEKRVEEERLAAEKKAEEERIAAEKKIEEDRIAAAKKAEEERKAEEARLEEERKQAEEVAREAKELEEVELQRQAEELAEIARRTEEELTKPKMEESDKPEETGEIVEQPVEPSSPPALAEDVATGDAESADEQADIPNEEVSTEIPATPEPTVEEPQTPEPSPKESEDPVIVEEIQE